ncbi:MAG: 23S rRNA (adenine(2503)-C(2))-methyltransferase RlmN [Atribacterota bacterium]|nr:23S rRNA (adenine(2503)-C(2))-methyltransferase RlmN [Atribacterota bacterium]
MDLEKKNIVGLLPQDLSSWLEERGEPGYRARQIFLWLYQRKVACFEGMTDLPANLRRRLADSFRVGDLQIKEMVCSQDGTEKFLFVLWDGNAVEGVLIPHRTRNTLCVSSQVGCPVGCPFCATGRVGFKRNLNFQEIVEEVWLVERKRRLKVENLVFMGMGEPLLNYDHFSRALRVINAQEGLRIGARRITVSTVGVPEAIIQLGRDFKEVNLAVSLHAPDNDLRSLLVPLNKVYPLSSVLKSVQEYITLTNRRVTVEYTLWQDVNDGAKNAQALAHLLTGMLVHVNVIPGNQVAGSSFRPASLERIERFVRILRENRINVTVRKSRGRGIQASCGELYRIREGKT